MKDKKVAGWIRHISGKQNKKMAVLIFANVIFAVITVVFAFAIKMLINGAISGNKDKVIRGAVFLVSLVIIGINLYGKYQASKMYNPDDVAPIISVKTGGGLSVLSQSTSVSEIYDLTTITNQGTQPQNPQPV
ncbi:MAG: hypothetical protein IJQ87_06070, partial [Clostridia bacterium]|nr:hypothetical protein [Clostridia bacterium]